MFAWDGSGMGKNQEGETMMNLISVDNNTGEVVVSFYISPVESCAQCAVFNHHYAICELTRTAYPINHYDVLKDCPLKPYFEKEMNP